MEQKTRNDEIVIDLGELFALIVRRIWIIIASTIVIGSATYLVSKFVIVPKYQSSTQIYVMNKQKDSVLTYSDIQSGTQLTKDYMTLVTSRPVIEEINTELDLGKKYSDLVELISVSNPDNTRILKITVEYTDPLLAKEIADAIREASANHIKTVMDIEKVNVIEAANLPEGKSSPNILKNTIVGAFMGAASAVIIIVILFISDDTIKAPEDVEKYLGLSVLSSIPVQAELKEISIKKKKREEKRSKKRDKEILG
jgi:capsular polysaccharide biosynthesis protein